MFTPFVQPWRAAPDEQPTENTMARLMNGLTILPGSTFTACDDGTLVAEASDFGGAFRITQLFNDSCDQGIVVEWQGVLLVAVFTRFTGSEWVLTVQGKVGPGHRLQPYYGHVDAVLIFND